MNFVVKKLTGSNGVVTVSADIRDGDTVVRQGVELRVSALSILQINASLVLTLKQKREAVLDLFRAQAQAYYTRPTQEALDLMELVFKSVKGKVAFDPVSVEPTSFVPE